MPIYEYACQSCGKLTDLLQKISDPAPEQCPNCNTQGTMSKVLSRSSFVLKGGGWYSDLYSSTKKDGAAAPSAGTAAAASAPAAPAPAATPAAPPVSTPSPAANTSSSDKK